MFFKTKHFVVIKLLIFKKNNIHNVLFSDIPFVVYYKNKSEKASKNKIVKRSTKGLRSEIKTTYIQYKTF